MTVDRKFRKMCETNKRGWDVRSDGRFFRVSFRSNDRFESTGFRASYQFQSEPPSTTETPAMSVSEQFNGNGSTICKCLLIYLLLTFVVYVYVSKLAWLKSQVSKNWSIVRIIYQENLVFSCFHWRMVLDASNSPWFQYINRKLNNTFLRTSVLNNFL